MGRAALNLRTVLTRISTTIFAAAALSWAIAVAPNFWSEAAIAQAAKQIIAGETYNPAILNRLDAALQSGEVLRPAILSKAAIIRLRRSEDVIASGDVQAINANLTDLGRYIDDALANTPADSFLWLARFWLENGRNGVNAKDLSDLKMSYALGRNEGWIAIKRSRVVMAVYPKLPPDLAEASVSEFVGLVRSGLYIDAADILTGPGWPIRDRLMARLGGVSESNRLAFAKLLYDRNVDSVSVPGIDPRPQRPWQH